MCVTANSEFSKASAMSMCLNQGEIPNDQVTAPVEIREEMIDPCLNQQTASATVAAVAHTVPPNPSIVQSQAADQIGMHTVVHNTVVRYTARSHESTRTRKVVEMGNVPVEYIPPAVETSRSSTLRRNTMIKWVLQRGRHEV